MILSSRVSLSAAADTLAGLSTYSSIRGAISILGSSAKFVSVMIVIVFVS